MFFAEDVARAAEPDSGFLELSEAWMKGQDRNGRTIVHVPQDLMQIVSGCCLVVRARLGIWCRHIAGSTIFQHFDRPNDGVFALIFLN
jgi:hypothetical protein